MNSFKPIGLVVDSPTAESPSLEETVKCSQCNKSYTKKVTEWSSDGLICDECLDCDLFGRITPSISPSEKQKIKKIAKQSASPKITDSPTFQNKKIETKSVSTYTCPGCYKQSKTNIQNCENCGRKSPLCR